MAKSNKGRKLFATSATAALVASAIVPVASAAQVNDFNSVSSYAQEAVQSLVDRGVITGDEKGNFNPKKTVSRAEAAKILSEALGLEATGSIDFSDVKAGAWYYDAIAAAVSNKVFEGQGAGKFNPTGNLTRSEAAKILVEAFDLEGTASLSEFKDAGSVKAWAKESLEIAVANGVLKGDNGSLKPNDAITKQDFAVMFHRTENLEAAPEVTGSVKAINNTTVEVTFDKDVTDLASLDFKIEGLDIEGKVVKQTDAKTVVLTTKAQTAGTTYAVTVNGDKVGSFTGVAEVIPTKIDVTSKSVQGVIGEQVSLTAKVTVPEGQSVANVPVTFNVTSDTTNNDKKEVTVLTNAEGVATYTYTRYYSGTDSFTAYATKKSTVYSAGKVYWANAKQLTVKDITEATTLVNGSKKVYEINSAKNAGGYVFVAFQENLSVTPDKAVRGAIIEGVTTYAINGNDKNNIISSNANTYPYSLSTGGTTVTAVKLDSSGKANLVVSGSNAVVTPIVYSADYTTDVNGTLTHVPAYSATALQAAASTATFELKHTLGLTIKAEGVQNAATYVNDVQTGGRDYTVTYTDKDGKAAAPGTLVKIAIPRVGGNISVLNSDGEAVGSIGSDAANVYYQLPVEAKGEFTFTVVSTSTAAYVSPIVFIDNGKTTGVNVLDTDDLQAQGEITYFVSTVSYSAALKALDAPNGKPVTSVVYGGTPAYFTYELVDQNGKPRSYNQDTVVSFELRAGTGDINVDGTVIKAGNTGTVRNTITAGNTSTNVAAYAYTPSAITATATGSRSGVVLPSTDPASVTVNFTQYGTSAITGTATNVNTALQVLTINNVIYSYADATYQYNNSVITKSAFVSYIANNDAKVSVTVDKDGKFTFNVLSQANVVDKVNAATTLAQVKAALAGYTTYEKLASADKDTVATTILGKLQLGTAYTAASLEAEVAPLVKITAASKYVAGTAATTGAKAAGTYANATTPANTLTIESAAGDTAYNGVKVVFEKATTVGTTVTTSYDVATKTLKVILPVSELVNGTLDAAATFAAVATAIGADTSTTLTGTLAGFTGTDLATELVGKTITLGGATASATAVAGTLTLTFSEAVSAVTAVTLNDASTTAVTLGTPAVSADGKTVVITLSSADEAVLAAAGTTAITTLTVTPVVTGQTVTVPVTITK
jgi:trimeric autotransporter adhesin